MTSGIPPVLVEQAEIEAFYSFLASATNQTRAAMAINHLRIGGGIALAAAHDPTQFWSRVTGLGFAEPVTAALLGQVIDFYRAQGMTSTMVHVAPPAMPADWADICAELSISDAGSTWVKLTGDVETAVARTQDAPLDAGLKVEPVTADRADEWAAVMCAVFGFPVDPQAALAAGSVGQPDWQHFAVCDGDRMVATAAVHVYAGTGHLFGAATLPEARGRGAQTALIAARARAAQKAGCQWLVGETGAEAPGEHNTSLHNMLRAGLTLRYERRNWTWTDDNGSAAR